MHVKYAFLQRSYSAPVRVCGATTASAAARAIAVRLLTGVPALRAVVPRLFVFVVVAVRAVVLRPEDDVLRGTSAVVRALLRSDFDVVDTRCWVG